MGTVLIALRATTAPKFRLVALKKSFNAQPAITAWVRSRITRSLNAQLASTAHWVRTRPSHAKLVCTAQQRSCQNRLVTAMKGTIVNLRRLTRQRSEELNSA